jgi:hypothetical protein
LPPGTIEIAVSLRRTRATRKSGWRRRHLFISVPY